MKYRLVRSTKKHQIQEFLDGVRPVRTEHPLVRLGGDGDGGYLVPDDLDGIEACYSPGIDRSSNFELACAERGMEVFMADASVKGPARQHPRFHFKKAFIGSVTHPPFITMERWIQEAASPPNRERILQMDIEGYEYECILSLPEDLLGGFRIMVIEFHELPNLFTRSTFDLAIRAFEKILNSHHCVHIHPNNFFPKPVRSKGFSFPRLAEFTFLRKDRGDSVGPALQFPHPLDRDCSDGPSLALPRCWYQQ